MSKWEKLLKRICSLSADVRFEELEKILTAYGYTKFVPSGGSSHYTFRKDGKPPITIPKHTPIKAVYVRLVKDIIESEEE